MDNILDILLVKFKIVIIIKVINNKNNNYYYFLSITFKLFNNIIKSILSLSYYIINNKLSNKMLIKWQSDMAYYDYEIEYIKGQNNLIADFLSRWNQEDL